LNFDTKAIELFDINYSLYSIIIQNIFYIIIGIWLGLLIYYRYNENKNRVESIIEFTIIGLNALLLSSFYFIDWFNINPIFPRWMLEYNNKLCTIGSIVFGYEIITLIKRLKRSKTIKVNK
jgi:hypothetical protein